MRPFNKDIGFVVPCECNVFDRVEVTSKIIYAVIDRLCRNAD